MIPTTGNLVGQRIGQIRILEMLGEGGMGTVYAAYHERLERKVAVKVVRPDRRMSENARRRFLQEARLLSQLNHPNICRVHDLFETPDGDFLVLELVEGNSLRQAIRGGLTRKEALSVAQQLLDVLAAVHRQGIVHRDLKPENVMIQPGGTIKVLDFGLARAVEDTRAPSSDQPETKDEGHELRPEGVSRPTPESLTGHGGLIGTLRYMSPEQAQGQKATPASDIYSAGMIMLEMLTGKPPFPTDLPLSVLLTKAAWGDLEHIDELPSSLRPFIVRLTSLAPADRPAARDAMEQLQLIVTAPQRHRRRQLVVATVALLALLAGGMTLQWVRASREAERARRSLAEAREVSGFLEDLFQLSNPFYAGKDLVSEGKAVPVEELLERGSRQIRERFADQPLARARFMMLLGRIQLNLGRFERAKSLFNESLTIRRASSPPGDPGLGESLRELGETERRLARYTDADSHLKEALSIEEKAARPDDRALADTQESLALLAESQGRMKEAFEILQRVYRRRKEGSDVDKGDLALTLQRLGVVEMALARYDDAREHMLHALSIVRRTAGRDHPSVASLLTDLANLESSAGNVETAEAYYRQGLEIARRSLPENHPLRAGLVTNLANVLDGRGKLDEAEPLYREALAIMEKTVGPEHPRTGKVLMNLAMLEHHQGRLDQAGHDFDRAVTVLEKSAGPRHPATGIAYLAYGLLEQDRHRYSSAEKMYARASTIFGASLGPEHPYTAMALNNLGEINRFQGKLSVAETYYRHALAINEKVLKPEDPSVAEVLRGLAITRAALGDRKEARGLFARAEKILRASGQPTDQLESDRREALDVPASDAH